MNAFDINEDIKKYNKSFAGHYIRGFVILFLILGAFLFVDLLALNGSIQVFGLTINDPGIELGGFFMLQLIFGFFVSIIAIGNAYAFIYILIKKLRLNALYNSANFEAAYDLLQKGVPSLVHSTHKKYKPSLLMQQVLIEYYHFFDKELTKDTLLRLGEDRVMADSLMTELSDSLQIKHSYEKREKDYMEKRMPKIGKPCHKCGLNVPIGEDCPKCGSQVVSNELEKEFNAGLNENFIQDKTNVKISKLDLNNSLKSYNRAISFNSFVFTGAIVCVVIFIFVLLSFSGINIESSSSSPDLSTIEGKLQLIAFFLFFLSGTLALHFIGKRSQRKVNDIKKLIDQGKYKEVYDSLKVGAENVRGSLPDSQNFKKLCQKILIAYYIFEDEELTKKHIIRLTKITRNLPDEILKVYEKVMK